jgi:peptidoglycan/xylan/chitin deacetylase (PgdA/CDA1 family)
MPYLTALGALCVVSLSSVLEAASLTRSHSRSTPVLLTFDVEGDDAGPALQKLQLETPATYFIAGRFAEDHPEVVRDLAANPRNTIGSHAYDHRDLTKLDPVEIRKDILLSKFLLTELTGYAPTWFRAPFLNTNKQVVEVLQEVGFTHDSSNSERWMANASLLELPISSQMDVLASDYDLFFKSRLSDEAALSWLVERYEERAVLGRPFVLLMHPKIIVEHAGVLRGFIEHAAQRGASFLGADDYVRLSQRHNASSLGVWINFTNGSHSAEQIAADLQSMGITEAFVMAKDPEGNRYFADSPAQVGTEQDVFGRIATRLKAAGIRVHAWLPVFRDPVLAQLRPEWAMVDQSGVPSTDWLSPSHPEVRAYVAAMIRSLLSNYEIDGLHVDYVRYPGLEYDYGTIAISKFEFWSRLAPVTVPALLADYYNQWIDWRALEISQCVAEVRELIRHNTARKVTLSAALVADAALNYGSLEKYGQSFSDLAAHLDWIIPMAYFREDRQSVDWIEKVVSATRFHVGDTPVLLGVEAYQQPGQWTFEKTLFEKSVMLARQGTDGIVLYPYLYLFGRSGTGRDLPPGSLDILTTFGNERPKGRRAQGWKGPVRMSRCPRSRPEVERHQQRFVRPTVGIQVIRVCNRLIGPDKARAKGQ